MKKHSISKIVEIYEKSGAIMYNATLNGDYRKNNREGRRLIKIFKVFEKEVDFGRKCIDELYKSENVVIKTTAAAYSLALSYNVDYAIEILQKISNDPNNGIFGFNAEMTLKVCREKGYLKIY